MDRLGTSRPQNRCLHPVYRRTGDPMEELTRYQRGQLVMRTSDERVLEIVAWDPLTNRYLLSDGEWVPPSRIEDPLRAGRRREVLRARIRDRDRSDAPEEDWTPLAILGWTLAVVQAGLILAAAALA